MPEGNVAGANVYTPEEHMNGPPTHLGYDVIHLAVSNSIRFDEYNSDFLRNWLCRMHHNNGVKITNKHIKLAKI